MLLLFCRLAVVAVALCPSVPCRFHQSAGVRGRAASFFSPVEEPRRRRRRRSAGVCGLSRKEESYGRQFLVNMGDLDFLNASSLATRALADVELMDARARADVDIVVTGELWERAAEGLAEFVRWSTSLARANAMGLTENLNLRSSLLVRLEVLRNSVDENQKVRESHLDDDLLRHDWAAIHTVPSAHDDLLEDDDDDFDFYFDDDDLLSGGSSKNDDNEDPYFEVVKIQPNEWAQITQSSFEVDSQVVYDTVIRGKWTVKNGKCHFLQETAAPRPHVQPQQEQRSHRRPEEEKFIDDDFLTHLTTRKDDQAGAAVPSEVLGAPSLIDILFGATGASSESSSSSSKKSP